jgi:hypothetical protein
MVGDPPRPVEETGSEERQRPPQAGATDQNGPADRFRLPAGLWVPLAVALVCFVVAYLQPFGISRDYADYEQFFDDLRVNGLSLVQDIRFEPGFVLLSYVLVLLSPSSLFVYALLAGIAAGVKFSILGTFAKQRHALVPVAVFYLVRFMPLHELTQLRAALAIALLLLAFRFSESGKRRRALLVGLSAVSLHMSSAIVLPFILLRVEKRREVLVIAGVTALALLGLFELLVSGLTPSLTVLAMYDQAKALGQEFQLDPLSLALLAENAFLGSMLALWSRLSQQMKHGLLIQLVGLVFFYGLSEWPIFGVRLRELFGVFSIVALVQGVTGSPLVRTISYGHMALGVIGYGRIHFFSVTEPLFE